MPDRDYNVIFNAPSDAAIASLDALIGKLTQVDKLCDVVRPKLAKIATDASRSINATAKACDGLAANLSKVNTSATGAASSVGKVAAQSVSAGRAAQQLRTHSDHATGAFGEWASKGLHLNATLLRVGYAAAGIQSGVAVWKGFTESLHNAEEYAKETAQHLVKLNDEIREMKIITGATAKEAREDLARTMTASSMDEQEATAFNAMWGSAIGKAKDSGNWKLSDEETEKSRLEVAHFTKQNKMDPAATGKMIPLMGSIQPFKTADDVFSAVGAIKVAGADAAGTFKQMAKADLKLMGQMVRPEGGGAFKNIQQLSAGVDAMSGFSDMGAAPAEMRAAWSEIVTPKSKKEGKALEGIGLVPGKIDMPGAVEKISDYIDAEQAKGVLPETAVKNLGVVAKLPSRGFINAWKGRKVWKAAMAKAEEVSDPAKIREQMEATDVESPHAMGAAVLQATRNRAGEDTFNIESMRDLLEAELEAHRGFHKPEKGEWGETLTAMANESMAMEDPRTLNQNLVFKQELLKMRPDLLKQIPEGEGGAGASESWTSTETLEKLREKLTPKEKAQLYRNVRGLTIGPNNRPVPRTKGSGTALLPLTPTSTPGVPGQMHPTAPAAVGPTASLGLGGDSPIQAEQLRTLRMIERKLGGGGGGYGGVYLPTDGGDNGPLRMG